MRRQVLVTLAAAALAVGVIRSRDAQSASAPDIEMLPSPTGPGSGEPFLATNSSGAVHMSWLEPVPAPNTGFSLRFASFDGAKWSSPSTIRTGRDFFVNWADFPSLEVFGPDRIAAHWLQRNGTTTYAYVVRLAISSDGGATWGAPMTPHTDSSATEHGFVAMWPESGSLGAAWLDGRQFDKTKPNLTNEMSVASVTISRSGSRGAESILDRRACDCCQVAATMTSDGPIVAYRDRTADEIRDISIVRRVAGKWTEPRVLHADNWKIPACPVNGPAISANGRQVALAWFTAARDTARVNIAFSADAGATFGAPIRVDQGAPAGRVDATILSDGSALVSWIERTGGDTAAVRLRRVWPQGRVTEPVTFAASSAARTSGFPRMSVSADRVYLAWTQPGRPSSVRVARVSLQSLR